jgi:hypothetical protein
MDENPDGTRVKIATMQSVFGIDAYGVFKEGTLAEWKAFTITEILGEGLFAVQPRGFKTLHTCFDHLRRNASNTIEQKMSAKWCTYGRWRAN